MSDMRKNIITLLGILVLAQPAYAGFKEHYDLAQEYASNYQYSSAITEFKNALKINYMDNSARVGLINAYLARGTYYANTDSDFLKAADDYRSALFYLTLYPSSNSIKNSAHAITQVNANLDKCLEFTKTDKSAKARFDYAKKLRAEGNFSAAGYEFSQALSDKDYVKESFEQLGDIMRIFGNDPKSAEYYRKAVAVDPNSIPLRLSYAKILDKLGSEDLAVQEYNYILSKSVDNKEVLYSLERIYKKKLEENPKDADIVSNLGAIMQKQEKFEDALNYYRQAEAIDPSNINTRLNVGTLYQQKGDYRTAIVAYDSILLLNPNNLQANLYKAQTLAAQGESKAAQTYFKKVLSLDPDNEIAQNQMFASAKASMTPTQYVDYVKKNASAGAVSDLLYSYALDLHKESKFEDAIKVYSELTKSADNPEIFINLAIAQGQMKNYDGAISTLKSAKSKFPNNEQIIEAFKNMENERIASAFDKAAEFFNNKDFESAIAEYSKIEPATYESMLGIASAYQNMENKPKAIEYYKKAFELKPTDSNTAYYIGALYAEEENPTASEEYLKRALTLNKNNTNASELLKALQEQKNATLLNEAIALYDGEKFDESLKVFNKLLITDPMNSYAYYYRGMIYDYKKNLNEAINNFRNALKYNPGDELNIVNYLIAVDLDTLEKYKDAYGYYQKYSTSSAPDDEYKEYAKSRMEDLKEYAK